MRLDTKHMRYLATEDWKTLTAVESGSRNHEVVPTPLIEQLSGLRGAVHKSITTLAKAGLIARLKNAKYDGYRLTYGGLDYLALNTYRKRNDIYSVGNQIGMGKESDILVVADEKGVQKILKIHRLGRISFRTVVTNRDYLKNRISGSWMYMSKLAALKEYTFMNALRDNGFPVPEPLAQSRHTIIMSLIEAFPLRQISSIANPALVYAELISLIMRLAQFGLIHGDFNEFNILMLEKESKDKNHKDEVESQEFTPILIDFPQMVSVDHVNAKFYFDRDVNCVKRFFQRRYYFVSDDEGPTFEEARKLIGKNGALRLDVLVEASGFSKKMAKELDTYMKAIEVETIDDDDDGDDGDENENENENDHIKEVFDKVQKTKS